LLSEMLQEKAYQVYEGRDGQEALTILEVRADVLVSDISMPNLNGLDLASIVSVRWPQIGIVFSSGHAPADLRRRMPERARFVAKPFREADLLKAVGAMIDTEIVPGPAVSCRTFLFSAPGRCPGRVALLSRYPNSTSSRAPSPVFSRRWPDEAPPPRQPWRAPRHS
jgi:CheY-like chemotaxis protein